MMNNRVRVRFDDRMGIFEATGEWDGRPVWVLLTGNETTQPRGMRVKTGFFEAALRIAKEIKQEMATGDGSRLLYTRHSREGGN